MTDQIVITEKSSQAKDVRAAVGSRYGAILPAEGHLLDLLEPEDVNPAWKRWTTELLKPEGLYGTKPATGDNKTAKLKAIQTALRTAKRVWLATDCDREGQLIARVSWSIVATAAKFRGCCSPRRIRRPFAKRSIAPGPTANMPVSMPPPWRAVRPTRSITCR